MKNYASHDRKTIRLKGYDYTQAGSYFITICVQNKDCLFGKIENGEMILNDAGIMIKKWYYELPKKFTDIRCHAMIIMPDHMHCIIENIGVQPVGSDLRVCTYRSGEQQNWDQQPVQHEHTDGDENPVLD